MKFSVPVTVKLTPEFFEVAKYHQLTPEELARRVCEDFASQNPPGSPVIFVLSDCRPERATTPQRTRKKGGRAK